MRNSFIPFSLLVSLTIFSSITFADPIDAGKLQEIRNKAPEYFMIECVMVVSMLADNTTICECASKYAASLIDEQSLMKCSVGDDECLTKVMDTTFAKLLIVPIGNIRLNIGTTTCDKNGNNCVTKNQKGIALCDSNNKNCKTLKNKLTYDQLFTQDVLKQCR